MDIRKHSKDRKKPVMRKRLKIAVFIAGFVCIALMVFRYFGFVSKTVYEESVFASDGSFFISLIIC